MTCDSVNPETGRRCGQPMKHYGRCQNGATSGTWEYNPPEAAGNIAAKARLESVLRDPRVVESELKVAAMLNSASRIPALFGKTEAMRGSVGDVTYDGDPPEMWGEA